MYRPSTSGLVVRLAMVNSIGFSSSTVVPLWLGDIAAHLGASTRYGGLVAVGGQTAAHGISNVISV
jgi:hypothetical protein